MKKYIIFIFILFYALLSSAQFIDDEEPEYASRDTTPKFADKLVFGGNISLMFGQYTYVNISPIVGYRITDEFTAGLGVIYEYVNDQTYKPSYETTIFGGKLFAQYVVFDYVILYAEDNILSLERKYYDVVHNYPNDGRFTLNVPWVGGGIYQKTGKGGLYFMILFNLNTERNSPYPNYDYRLGFNF